MPAVPAAALASGEPGFPLVGARRATTFLLHTGFAQLDTILDQPS